MTRYTVAPLADENCDSLAEHTTLLRTDDAVEAKAVAEAENHNFIFGTGILDAQTGQLDVGFGFGVPCPPTEEG